jgi:hypothetical protein
MSRSAHDHRFFFTAEKVYKGNPGVINCYSGRDHGGAQPRPAALGSHPTLKGKCRGALRFGVVRTPLRRRSMRSRGRGCDVCSDAAEEPRRIRDEEAAWNAYC